MFWAFIAMMFVFVFVVFTGTKRKPSKKCQKHVWGAIEKQFHVVWNKTSDGKSNHQRILRFKKRCKNCDAEIFWPKINVRDKQ